MADLIRMGGIVGIPKDRLGSPSSGSDDGGVGVDLADLAHELDVDEFDGPLLVNGAYVRIYIFIKMTTVTIYIYTLKCKILMFRFTLFSLNNRRRSSGNYCAARK